MSSEYAVNVRAICQERLDSWREVLVNDEATPAVLVGVGHGARLGNLTVCLPDGLSFRDAADLLERVALRLRGQA